MLKQLFEKYRNLIFQFSRFAGIGFLNTAVDFSVINILVAGSGITAGLRLSIFKIISFTIAVSHSYYWNKYWAFGKNDGSVLKFLSKLIAVGASGLGIVVLVVWGARQQFSWLYFAVLAAALFIAEVILWKLLGLSLAPQQSSATQQMGKFLAVSVSGALLSAAIVGYVPQLVPPLFGVNSQLWVNMVNIGATLIVLFWNFIGYKIFVFRQ